MSFVLKDRVKETSTTTGTGTFTLAGAATGFQSFSVIGNGNTTFYCIVDSAAGAWEVGIGTYTSSGTTLSRDTILESSNSGAAVNFGSGSKDVFVTYPAEKSATVDTFAEPPAIGSTTASTGAFTAVRLNGSSSGYVELKGAAAAGSTTYTFPSSDGTSGQVLSTSGTGTLSWASSGGSFPSGTVMLFVQTSAPTGWTKSTAHDNKALRVVSGTASSGGSVGFTTAFASQAVSGTNASTTATNNSYTPAGSVSVSGTVGSTTLSTSQIPSHQHWIPINTPANAGGSVWGSAYLSNGANMWGGNAGAAYAQYSEPVGGGGSHNHSFSGSGSFSGTAATITQTSHSHTFTGTAINLAVQYVDTIIATKD